MGTGQVRLGGEAGPSWDQRLLPGAPGPKRSSEMHAGRGRELVSRATSCLEGPGSGVTSDAFAAEAGRNPGLVSYLETEMDGEG